MKMVFENHSFATTRCAEFVDLTDDVVDTVEKSDVQNDWVCVRVGEEVLGRDGSPGRLRLRWLDRLRLLFTCCHPALSPDAQIALTLREVCGLTTEEVANEEMSGLFEGAVEATEEAIYNSLFQATSVTGSGHTIEAIPLDKVRQVLAKFHVTERWSRGTRRGHGS